VFFDCEFLPETFDFVESAAQSKFSCLSEIHNNRNNPVDETENYCGYGGMPIAIGIAIKPYPYHVIKLLFSKGFIIYFNPTFMLLQ